MRDREGGRLCHPAAPVDMRCLGKVFDDANGSFRMRVHAPVSFVFSR